VSAQHAGLTRREFLRLSGGLLVLFGLAPELAREAAGAAGGGEELSSWLHVGPDGRVTVFADAQPLGQGIATALAQLAAEELGVEVSVVSVVLGDTDRVVRREAAAPAAALATVGARVREAAAEAREALAALAAEDWGVPRASVVVEGGKVALRDQPGRVRPIGELVRGRRLVRRAGPRAAPRPPGERRVVGTSAPRVDGRALVTGEARFVGDLRVPEMVYAAVFRPPCLGARLVSVDTRAAAGQPGVIAVARQADFIAVVATRPDLAERALQHLQATWEEPDHPSLERLYRDLRESAQVAEVVQESGNVEAALAGARRGFSAAYRAAFVAHAPIEPQGALAVPEGERMTVYANTQRPFEHRAAVAEALGIPPAGVRVIVPPVGGAFGGKDAPEVSVRAARLARLVGRPVSLVRSRREEMTWGYFRPAALIEVRCGVGADGRVAAWEADVLNCGPRGAALPYGFPNVRVRSHRCRSPLPQGHWRGDGGSANAFAREVHLDHVASELGADPVEFRLRHLAGDERLAAVLRAAAERFGWRPRHAPTGRGVGVACAVDGGVRVAEIAEVQVERSSGAVRVRRVVVAQDSGLVVNPDGLGNQIEGAVVMGLGFTLREAVRCEQGRILSDRFLSYPIPTFRDAPEVEVVLAPQPLEPPRGGGVAPIMPIAAAVANAIFDATGRRLRDLPMTPDRVLAALRG